MNCTKCGSDEVEHDCESIYCYNCGHVEKYVDRSEIIPFTAPILCMLSSIPILNILMYLIAHIKKKKKYKDLILANILLCFMALMLSVLGVLLFQDYFREDYMRPYLEETAKVASQVLYQQDINEELSLQIEEQLQLEEELESERKLLETIKENNKIIDNLSSDTEFRLIDYLDGVTLKGSKVRQLLDDLTKINSCCVMFQTVEIDNKYEDSYIMYGVPIIDEKDTYYISDKKFIKYTNKFSTKKLEFDDNSFIICEDVFDDKKTIYYVKDNSLFDVDVEQVGLITLVRICEQSIKESKK